MSDYYPDRDPDDQPPYYEEELPPPFWRRPMFLGVVAVLVVFGVVVSIAYNRGVESGEQRLPPLVQAQPGPMKVKPDEPGGMEVQHQDKLIYGTMGGRKQTEPVEQLLPGPEEPVDTSAAEAPKPAQTPAGGMASAPGVGSTSNVVTGGASGGAPAATATNPAAGTPGPDAAPQVGPRLSDLVKRAPKQPANTPPPPPRVATLEQPAGGYFIQLGAVRDPTQAQAEWGRLSRKMPDLLGNRPFVARRADLGAKGIFYRLQTGPLGDREAAARLCEQVKVRGQGCIVVAP